MQYRIGELYEVDKEYWVVLAGRIIAYCVRYAHQAIKHLMIKFWSDVCNLFKACKKRLATVTASNINVNNSAEHLKSILACFQSKKEIVLSDDIKKSKYYLQFYEYFIYVTK